MLAHIGIQHGTFVFCALNFIFFCCKAFYFFFLQTSYIFGSLIQTIDSVMAHMTCNLDENSLPSTVESTSSVAGRI